MIKTLYVQLLKIACLTLMYLSIIYTQSLYENDYQQYQTFNRDSRESSYRSSLDITRVLLEEIGIKLKECNVKQNLISNTYKILEAVYNQGLKPNDSNIAHICARYPNFLVGSSSNCHRFYDCSKRNDFYQIQSIWPTPYLHECPYPFLFSEETLQCKNYTEVLCGTRFKPTWECRYFKKQCHLAHCIPCEYRFPKCEYRENGLWTQPKTGGSSFMICQNGRTVETGTCPKDEIWNEQTYPYKGQCIHRSAIPFEYNYYGYLPSCYRKTDGNYQYIERCDAYYKCADGEAAAVKCPNSTGFDTVRKSCKVGEACTPVI